MRKKLWLSDKDYDFIYSRAPRACIDLVVKTPKGILLGKREIQPYKGLWHFPGGRIKFRETVNQAVERIAKAEFGVTVKTLKFLGFMEFLREVQNGRPRHTISLVFLAAPESGSLQGSWQAREWKFFKAVPPGMIPIHREFLKQKKLI